MLHSHLSWRPRGPPRRSVTSETSVALRLSSPTIVTGPAQLGHMHTSCRKFVAKPWNSVRESTCILYPTGGNSS